MFFWGFEMRGFGKGSFLWEGGMGISLAFFGLLLVWDISSAWYGSAWAILACWVG